MIIILATAGCDSYFEEIPTQGARMDKIALDELDEDILALARQFLGDNIDYEPNEIETMILFWAVNDEKYYDPDFLSRYVVVDLNTRAIVFFYSALRAKVSWHTNYQLIILFMPGNIRDHENRFGNYIYDLLESRSYALEPGLVEK